MGFSDFFRMFRFRRTAAALLAVWLIALCTGCASPGAELPSQPTDAVWTEPSEPTIPSVPTESSAPTQPTLPPTEPPRTEAPTELPTTEPPVTEMPTTEPSEVPTQPQSEIREYVLNTNTKKFHLPECKDVGRIKDKNRKDYEGPREDLLAQGYTPCGHCHP